jgi:hypothetical protein
MGKVVLKSEAKTIKINGEEKEIWLLDNKLFNKFNPYVLKLGNISMPSEEVEAIAAVFDLSGFTTFCSHSDPHLIVPEYLSRFLAWLFRQIKQRVVRESYKEGKELWAELPFLAKFLGDGVLFLWNTKNMSGIEICNVVAILNRICNDYQKEFYPEIRTVVAEPPQTLRCGIARGKVCSVGNGEDYIGPCINIASRLQKLSQLTFCFPRKGFDIDKHMHRKVKAKYVEKRVTIPGIRENELVWVRKDEFEQLPKEEKRLFREP